MGPNFLNRTLYHGDNLDFLRGMNSETVHLIATDPPFNKGRDFHATPDSLARARSSKTAGRGKTTWRRSGLTKYRTIGLSSGKSSTRRGRRGATIWPRSCASWASD